MQIEKIHSFLTKPAKAIQLQPPISGATVVPNTKLYSMLEEVFAKSLNECSIDISFNPIDGQQVNAARTLLLKYAQKPTIPNGRRIAESLQVVTTHRSGLGLLFLIVAREGSKTRFLVSRFPADVGVLAEEAGNTLNVEFIEKVFMKNANSYKSALFEDVSFLKGFWNGKATDKQINNSDVFISDYWIRQFLHSDFRTTPEAGTRRLAIALRNAARNASDITVKTQLSSVAQLIQGLPEINTSIFNICSQFNLKSDARESILNELPNRDVATEQFRFSSIEFNRHIQYRVMELDNGGLLTAEANKFEDVFSISPSSDQSSVVIRTQGKIVDDKLRKSK